MNYNVMVTSEPVPGSSFPPGGEFDIRVTVELLGDDNPEFDMSNGPHHIKIESPDDWNGRLTVAVIDAQVREWLLKWHGIES